MTMRFSAVGLIAGDMKETLAFYRLLGFDIPAEADAEEHVEVTVAGGVRLMWDSMATVRTIDPGWTPPSGGHRAALAFDCGTPAEVDRAYAELTAAGYPGHHAPWDAFWGQRYATVTDPDGNPVDMFAALPG
ncbi:VOC family protein [Haloechinothrix sp. LS1_15]|uniref:VOC family protein n=1 Tax=Haloechinothrix sp. LS1_15 TaxID=2652248 RepID=UPI002947DB76|nr:VOC family protein [Haloechinothrix sp. LS1_15]MDV6011161.1 glyoxalase [Haloechinothrix sp. LS1_15]